MDIRKADSKGRVSGFTPGELYAFDREKGYFSPVIINPPDGRPVVVESGPIGVPTEYIHPWGSPPNVKNGGIGVSSGSRGKG